MSKHEAKVVWRHSIGDFLKGTYSRVHQWTFDGGVTVPASAALSSVPLPYSDAACVDPEEAYVAAISSCHMLTFLYLASKAGVEVLGYEDNACGTMTENWQRKKWVSEVVLRPKIEFGKNGPSSEEEAKLHEAAHQECYIANSVKTKILVEVGR